MNKKIAYLVPNFFTAGSLVCALVAMNLIANEEFIKAVYLITLSILFDGLDGRMARLLNAMSKIGAQADSLADFVAFGVVPGFLAWQVALKDFGAVGFVVFMVYVLCGGFRLARFNVMSANAAKKEDFTGLPIPAAAATVASFVLFNEVILKDYSGNLILLLIMVLVSWLMVSKIPYIAVNKPQRKKRVTTMIVVFAAAIIIFSVNHFVWVYIICAWLYILFGLYNQSRILITKGQEKRVYARKKKGL
jgi:CDP-diacylglycerol--serine O-phosphatidyltransferase